MRVRFSRFAPSSSSVRLAARTPAFQADKRRFESVTLDQITAGSFNGRTALFEGVYDRFDSFTRFHCFG
jgi:hypothetical protein